MLDREAFGIAHIEYVIGTEYTECSKVLVGSTRDDLIRTSICSSTLISITNFNLFTNFPLQANLE